MNKTLNKNIFFFLILLLGALLRIDSLNFDNLWYDEIMFLVIVRNLTFTIL